MGGRKKIERRRGKEGKERERKEGSTDCLHSRNCFLTTRRGYAYPKLGRPPHRWRGILLAPSARTQKCISRASEGAAACVTLWDRSVISSREIRTVIAVKVATYYTIAATCVIALIHFHVGCLLLFPPPGSGFRKNVRRCISLPARPTARLSVGLMSEAGDFDLPLPCRRYHYRTNNPAGRSGKRRCSSDGRTDRICELRSKMLLRRSFSKAAIASRVCNLFAQRGFESLKMLYAF